MAEPLVLLGTHVARRLGLNQRYFANAYSRGLRLHDGVSVEKMGGLLFVTIPNELAQYMTDSSYTICKLGKTDDETMFDHIFHMSKDARIGFYK